MTTHDGSTGTDPVDTDRAPEDGDPAVEHVKGGGGDFRWPWQRLADGR